MPLVYLIAGSAVALLMTGFTVISLLEHERRAALLGALFTAAWTASWLMIPRLIPLPPDTLALGLLGGGLALLVLLALPLGRSPRLAIRHADRTRVDERDIMFARYRLPEDSPQYKTYYDELRPELASVDERIRRMPPLGTPGGKYYVEPDSAYFDSLFRYIEQIHHLGEIATPSRSEPLELSPEEATRRIKAFARQLGALQAGVTRLKPHHLYSHVGRGKGRWGEEISSEHSFAVALAVEMDHRLLQSAPRATATTESAVQYLRSAMIAAALAEYCSRLGYRARAHVDGNYQLLATAVAHDAGLGELGRLGLLITPTHGPRVRTAVVTTDLPLVEDEPICFGVQDFCRICLKCARNCPGGAISPGEKELVRGVEKWPASQEKCYGYWLHAGTDCGLCITVCPYAKPATAYHNLIRALCTRNALARRIALRLDDLFYGRHPRKNELPDWFSKS